MDYDILHILIDRYYERLDILYQNPHREQFKWKAVGTFQRVWKETADQGIDFEERFSLAMKDRSVLMDGRSSTPTSAILAFHKACCEYEKDKHKVVNILEDTVFSGEKDPVIIQDRMENFIVQMEQLRMQYYPGSWRYKIERHAASCLLSLYAPDTNYIYQCGKVLEFADYVHFGKEIGYGSHFNLSNYYELCDLVEAELRKRTEVVNKHAGYVLDQKKYYHGDSLHLMVWDLIYCCGCYRLYDGLTKHRKPVKPGKKPPKKTQKEELLENLHAVEEDIRNLETQISEFEDISLLNVVATSETFGTGRVVSQNRNILSFEFDGKVIPFLIDAKTKTQPNRPRFEDDDAIVEILSAYATLTSKLGFRRSTYNSLKKKLMDT